MAFNLNRGCSIQMDAFQRCPFQFLFKFGSNGPLMEIIKWALGTFILTFVLFQFQWNTVHLKGGFFFERSIPTLVRTEHVLRKPEMFFLILFIFQFEQNSLGLIRMGNYQFKWRVISWILEIFCERVFEWGIWLFE